MPPTILVSVAAASAAAPLTEHQVLVFLLQVMLLVGVARALGTVMKRLGQPPVVGELLAGVVLGPSLLGVVWPAGYGWLFTDHPVVNSATFGLAWLGVVMLLVVMGFETDLGIISRFRAVAGTVATGSLVAPMIVTSILGYSLSSRFAGSAEPSAWVFAAFFALALSVSALPVVGKILTDMGVMRRNFGQITLAAAMAKDAVGWLILAVLSGIAVGGLRLSGIVISFGGLAVFVVFMFTVGRRLLDAVFRMVLSRGSDVTAGMSIALVLALAGAAVTQALHVEAILGAYVVGLTLARLRHQLPQVRERLETVTAAFFAPVFFGMSGLRVDVTVLADWETVAWTVAAIVLAMSANIGGTILSGRLAGVDPPEAVALGAGLSPLGVMGVVVAIVGLNVGVINEAGYTILILAAVVTSLIAPVLLTWAVGRWQPPAEEADRLERESLREDAEILGASRILLPTRGGLNSAYAARLIAGVFPEAEVTVLTVDVRPRRGIRHLLGRSEGGDTDSSEVVQALGETPSRVLSVTAQNPAQAILDESRLGYDLLVIGASRAEHRVASSVVERVLRETGIQTMVVQLPTTTMPAALPQHVLVPVTASRSSRAAEEFGYSLVSAFDGQATALHVVNRADGEGVFLAGEGVDEGLRAAADMLWHAKEFGRRLGIDIVTRTRVTPHAEQEILDYARQDGIDLIVLGTSNRPVTHRPFFGHRISYISEHADLPLVILALPSLRGSS